MQKLLYFGMDWIAVVLWIAALVTVLAGLAGLVIPALPGVPLLLGGILLAGWAENFQYLGTGTIIILVILAVLAYLADFMAGALGAKKYGAGKRAAIGAAIGALAGMFLGLPGIILGPFVGAFLGELSSGRKIKEAAGAGYGAWLGMLAGTAAKFAIAFIMIGIYLFQRIF